MGKNLTLKKKKRGTVEKKNEDFYCFCASLNSLLKKKMERHSSLH